MFIVNFSRMAAEDVLYRVMIPVVKHYLRLRREAGDPVEPTVVVETTLQEFARSIALEPHEQALRERLLAHLAAGNLEE